MGGAKPDIIIVIIIATVNTEEEGSDTDTQTGMGKSHFCTMQGMMDRIFLWKVIANQAILKQAHQRMSNRCLRSMNAKNLTTARNTYTELSKHTKFIDAWVGYIWHRAKST